MFNLTNSSTFPLRFIRSAVPYWIGEPTLAFADDSPLDPADVQAWGNEDTNRIQGNILKAVARSAPYIDILEGGNLPAGVSETQRAIVQEIAVLNDSLVRPVFTPDIEMCGKTGEGAEVGSTEYTYRLETKRGMGPLVCVKKMRNAFETAYAIAEDALKAQLIQLNNADVRITLVDRSGLKATCHTGLAFESLVDGSMQAIDTPFPVAVGKPDTSLTWGFLNELGIYMREAMLVEPFDTDPEPTLRLLAGQSALNILRDTLSVTTDHRYMAAGSYRIGEVTLMRYRWEGPYRGWAFGVDPMPLRYSVLTAAGQPSFIEPLITVQTSKGVGSRPNPAWVRAKYEVALAMGQQSFLRLAPEQYTGEGSFKLPAQLSMGELQWRVIIDNTNNAWGDFGRHFWQLERAYKAQRPHAVCAIAFKRAPADFGFAAIADWQDYSNTASL